MELKTSARMDQLAPSGIRKVNEKALAMERAGEHVIHFEIGRPDFDTPEYIKKAAEAALDKGDVFYTSNFGTLELRQEIANKLKRQNNVDYKASPRLSLLFWPLFWTMGTRSWSPTLLGSTTTMCPVCWAPSPSPTL